MTLDEIEMIDGTRVNLRYASASGDRLKGETMRMCEIERLEDGDFSDLGYLMAGKLQERNATLAFIREQAKTGTADYEYKLLKLAEAIERGDHEED